MIGAGSWGTGFARLLADRAHEVTLVCRDPGQAATIAETGRNPRAVGDVALDGIAVVSAAPAGGGPVRPRRAQRVLLRGGRGAPSGRAGPLADQGARPGDRRPPLDARARPAGRRAVGPEHGRGGLRRAPQRGGGRERGRGARGRAPERDQLDRLPRLRQHRPGRGRALRRGEERDRACRRRRRRPRRGRQRQGGADHPRPGGDGAAGRGVRRAAGDVRGSRRDGRPDRHLLEPARPEPPGGRADRPGARRRPRRSRRSARWSRA